MPKLGFVLLVRFYFLPLLNHHEATIREKHVFSGHLKQIQVNTTHVVFFPLRTMTMEIHSCHVEDLLRLGLDEVLAERTRGAMVLVFDTQGTSDGPRWWFKRFLLPKNCRKDPMSSQHTC